MKEGYEIDTCVGTLAQEFGVAREAGVVWTRAVGGVFSFLFIRIRLLSTFVIYVANSF